MPVVLLLLLAAALLLARGVVLTVLWGWFVVPVFGLPALTVPVALGLVILVRAVLEPAHSDGKSERTTADAVGWAVGGVVFPLLFGWLVHLCM